MIINSKRRAYIKSLGTKEEPMLRIGKENLTENIITALEELLEARELVKVRMLNNSTEDLKEAARAMAERTKSELIGVTGNTILLFRENRKKPVISNKIKEI
jgi:RNA-binding protein